MASWTLSWIRSLTLVAGLVTAIPTISFPINSQVPPVARIDSPFSFVFAPSTFSSSSALTYALANPPSWLSIDGEARRLYGTPREQDVAPGDVVGVTVDIVATDDSGSVTQSATLVVSRGPAPNLSIPLAQQAPDFAPFSQPSSFIIRPDTTFAFSLASNTFTDPVGRPLTYYAVMADNSPLPAWIVFDPTRLSFTGRTPPLEALIQTPQPFDFRLVASDVVGFAGAVMPFSFVVANHGITAVTSFITLNATVGERLSYIGLVENVRLDDRDAKTGGVTIRSVSGLPAWLAVDSNTWEVSGMPWDTANSSTFTITMQDQFSDTLNLTITVNLVDGLFMGSLPALNLTAGEHFVLELDQYLRDPADTDISIVSNPPTAWVKFDADKNVLSGDVPISIADSHIVISINARSRRSHEEHTEALTVIVTSATFSPPPKKSTSTDSPPASTSSPAHDQDTGGPTSKQILIAVLIPNLLLLITILAIAIYCIRKHRRQLPPISRLRISRPVPGTFVQNTSGDVTNSVRQLNRMYDTACEATSTSQLTPYRDPSLPTPPPSRDEDGTLTPPKRNPRRTEWPTETPTRKTAVGRGMSFYADDTPSRAYAAAHNTRYSRSQPPTNALGVEIPSGNIFGLQSTPDSAYFVSTDDLALPCVSGKEPDRNTALSDFMRPWPSLSPSPSPYPRPLALTIRRVEGSESPALPPRVKVQQGLRTPEGVSGPFYPRRLFADLDGGFGGGVRSGSPADGLGERGPLGRAPWRGGEGEGICDAGACGRDGEDGDGDVEDASPCRPSVRTWSSVYSGQHMDEWMEGMETPCLSPSRWPVPPGRRREGVVMVEEQEQGGEEVGDGDWTGVVRSSYEKGGSWPEAGGRGEDGEGEGEVHAGIRWTSESGSGTGSGEYAFL